MILMFSVVFVYFVFSFEVFGNILTAWGLTGSTSLTHTYVNAVSPGKLSDLRRLSVISLRKIITEIYS